MNGARCGGGRDITVRPKHRPVAWLLQLIEEFYDAAYALECREGDRPKVKEVQGGTYADMLPADIRASMDEPRVGPEQPSLCAPQLAFRLLAARQGARALVLQSAADMLFMAETCEDTYPEASLFLCFLRELHDVDVLLFFLHCRQLLQRSFRLRFARVRAPLPGQGAARQHLPDGSVVLARHPRFAGQLPGGNAGVEQVFLSVDALTRVCLHASMMASCVCVDTDSVYISTERMILFDEYARKMLVPLGVEIIDARLPSESRWGSAWDGLHYMRIGGKFRWSGDVGVTNAISALNAIFGECAAAKGR